MLFVVPVVLFDMLKAKQLACVSESGQKCPAARSLSLRRAWIEIAGRHDRYRRDRRSPYGERGLKYVIGGTNHLEPRRSPYGERGLKSQDRFRQTLLRGRSPYGERGLKYTDSVTKSHHVCRSPYGERGLKSVGSVRTLHRSGRSPYGERGLKYDQFRHLPFLARSLSLRRAWIEIWSPSMLSTDA